MRFPALLLCAAIATLAASAALPGQSGSLSGAAVTTPGSARRSSPQGAESGASARGGGFPAVDSAWGAPLSPTYAAYRISAHDVLVIEVYQAPEFTRPARVKTDGTIRLPLFQEPVQVAGLTPFEAETAIADALIGQGLLVDPIVTVEVQEYHGSPVRVSGAVRQSVVFQAVGPTTLLDALTQAGGLKEDAGSEILVQRPARDGQPAQMLRIPTEEFRAGLRTAQELPLYGGERVRVPPAPTAFVIGDVGNPGPVPIAREGGVDFLELMALVGARMDKDSPKKAFVLRPRGQEAGREKIEVDIKKLVEFEMASFQVHPDDVVYFPPRKGRGLLKRFVEAGLMNLMFQGIFVLWR